LWIQLILIFEFVFISGAQCTYGDKENISPPDFLKTDMSADDIIIAGMSINFYCQQDGKMLPFEVDQDSNFLLEVYCVDGEFQGFIKVEPAYFFKTGSDKVVY